MHPRVNAQEWFDLHLQIADEHPTLAVTIESNPRLSIGAPRLEFEGKALASDSTRTKTGALTIEAHDVPPCTLILPIRANVPIDERETTLRARLADRAIEIPVQLEGAPAFIGSRCRWKVPKTIGYLQPTRATLRVRNDGTAAARNVEITIPLRSALHLTCESAVASGEHGTPALAAFVEFLDVGAHVDLDVDVTVLDPSLEACQLVADVRTQGAQTRIETQIPLAAGAMAKIDVAVPEYAVVVGETIPVHVSITGGARRVERASVRLQGEGIRERERILTGLEPLETRTFILYTELTRAQTGVWMQPLDASFACEDTQVSARAHISAVGSPRLRMRASEERMRDGLTHRVVVSLDNDGLGVAQGVAFDVARVDGIFAVTDSLAVDGLPVFRVDGSAPVFEGIELGSIDIFKSRSLSFQLRADHEALTTLTLHARIQGEIVASTTLDVAFADARARGEQMEPEARVEPEPQAQVVAEFEPEPEPQLQTEPEPQPEREPEPEPEPEPQVRYRSESGEFTRLFIPSLNVPLGQIVLGLFEMIPTALGGRADDPDLVELRSEVRAIQLRYANSLESGNFGVSGFNVTPSSLVRALGAVRARLGYSALVDSETRTVVLGLLEILDGEDEFGARLRGLRDRVATAVRDVTDEEMFLDVHPLIEVAA